jgi:hypothetical protein
MVSLVQKEILDQTIDGITVLLEQMVLTEQTVPTWSKGDNGLTA